MADTARKRPPNAGKGRPKGSKNKLTASIKGAYLDAFDQLGGVASLVRWGKENPTAFYTQVARLIPTDVQHQGGVTVTLEYVEADD